MPVSSIISVSFHARDPFAHEIRIYVYICIPHSEREGESEARTVIPTVPVVPADQTVFAGREEVKGRGIATLGRVRGCERTQPAFYGFLRTNSR